MSNTLTTLTKCGTYLLTPPDDTPRHPPTLTASVSRKPELSDVEGEREREINLRNRPGPRAKTTESTAVHSNTRGTEPHRPCVATATYHPFLPSHHAPLVQHTPTTAMKQATETPLLPLTQAEWAGRPREGEPTSNMKYFEVVCVCIDKTKAETPEKNSQAAWCFP